MARRNRKTAKKRSIKKIIKGKKVLRNAARARHLEHERPLYGIEEILINNIINQKEAYPDTRLLLHELLYNATDSMRDLAYRYGFYIGRELHYSSGSSGMELLVKTLGNVGFGRILYYPSEGMLIIRSSNTRRREKNVNQSMHVYESGIIAGYLSSGSGSTINTAESHCIYSGSAFCQFVSMPESQEQAQNSDESPMKVRDIIQGIFFNIKSNELDDIPESSQNYLMLSILPMLKKPLADNVSKILFVAGKRLAESTIRSEWRRMVKNIACFFDIKYAKIIKSKKRVSVLVGYKDYNSVDQFVNLSTHMFIGFLSALFKSRVNIGQVSGKDKSGYAVKLDVSLAGR